MTSPSRVVGLPLPLPRGKITSPVTRSGVVPTRLQGAAVNTNSFWALVGATRREAAAAEPTSVVEEHIGTLTAELEELSDDEIAGFHRELRAARARANDWNLWAAAYLALGGASDDSFLDFRNC
jgi:hypothetical protein